MGQSVKHQPFVKMFGSRGKVTPRQERVYELYLEHRSLTEVARILGITPANVSAHLARRERNICIMHGVEVPSVKTLLKSTKDGTNSYERASLILASKNGVTTEQFEHRPLMLSEEESFEEEKPEPRRIFATGEKVVKRTVIPLPKRGVMTVFFTCSQDATPVHSGLWKNIEAYHEKRSDRGEALIFSGQTLYNKGMFGDPASQERHFLDPAQLYELDDAEVRRMVFFDQCLDDKIIDHRVEIDGILEFAGEMNTSPTAVTPLSGLQTHTGPRWGIFPHVKQHLESIPRLPDQPYKANMTTGCVTMPNYIRKKAGMKAEANHTLGFVIVEVLPDGRFWARHVTADPETGSFHDLDVFVHDGIVEEGHRVASISYGDVHHEVLDADVARVTWGIDVEKNVTVKKWAKKSLFERLKPEYQFFHDISDFTPRNHHNRLDPEHWIRTAFDRKDDVLVALDGVSQFLRETRRKWCRSMVVKSNHDSAFPRWLDTPRVIEDGVNAWIYFHANAIKTKAIMDGKPIDIFEHILRERAPDNLAGIEFIDGHKSFKVYGVEHALHGDQGPNGSRGTPMSIFKLSLLITAGHVHSPWVRDGGAGGGVCQTNMAYAAGKPTSWAVAHVVGHIDGSRQLVFKQGNAFHA